MLFLIVLIYIIPLLMVTIYQIVFKGKWEWVIFFMILFLPAYTVILSITYQATTSVLLTNVFKYMKELVLLLALLSFILYRKNIFDDA